MNKVSVLVAVYNAAPFLPKCLESLTNQTFANLQIVCVDDCSTDDSLSVLNEYARQDDRIKVVERSVNGGIAKARNSGLAVADGDFVCMVDADDWLATDAIAQAVKVFQGHPLSDCVLLRFVLAYQEGNVYRLEDYPCEEFECLSGEEAFLKSLDWRIHGIYMVRMSIQQRFRYDESARFYSDENTARLHYFVSREVRQCAGIYYYLQHSASATHAVSGNRFDSIKAKESLRQWLQQLSASPQVIADFESDRWLNVVDMYFYYFQYRHKGLSIADATYGLSEIHRAWRSIDISKLPSRLRRKFGYCPLRFSWWAFRLQEELYFWLRSLLHRNG